VFLSQFPCALNEREREIKSMRERERERGERERERRESIRNGNVTGNA